MEQSFIGAGTKHNFMMGDKMCVLLLIWIHINKLRQRTREGLHFAAIIALSTSNQELSIT